MLEFSELNDLFKSATIKPSFKKVHVILSLFIFGENPQGIGRYRLKKELSIGSGTARSLITKLNEKTQLITVDNEIKGEKSASKRKGHVLTEKGIKFLNKIKKSIPILEEADPIVLEDLIIQSKNSIPFYCLVKNKANLITTGIVQRDAAILINGTGTTCLIYDGKELSFPSSSFTEHDEDQINISKTIQDYFLAKMKKYNINLEKKDVIIIGLGQNSQIARLAALNAALTLF